MILNTLWLTREVNRKDFVVETCGVRPFGRAQYHFLCAKYTPLHHFYLKTELMYFDSKFYKILSNKLDVLDLYSLQVTLIKIYTYTPTSSIVKSNIIFNNKVKYSIESLLWSRKLLSIKFQNLTSFYVVSIITFSLY